MTINDIKYTWELTQLHVIPSLKDQANVVTKIGFTLHGEYIDETGTSFKDFWSGVTLIEFDENSNFTSYDQLTPEIVEKWVEASENKKQRNVDWIKGKVLKRIQERVTPSIVVINSPFTQK